MPSETIYLPEPQMDMIDDVMHSTDADNRSQAIQLIIEGYEQ